MLGNHIKSKKKKKEYFSAFSIKITSLIYILPIIALTAHSFCFSTSPLPQLRLCCPHQEMSFQRQTLLLLVIQEACQAGDGII